ncbi:hypothetical protein Dsin_000983 [Dipteronia sinensis]|uniref:Uncharacterized protein n=1 Tax=Dipteronia sinensis TaxID=43782 RepID=A0AAE0EIK0_9ROSI|nr:hypothetical protein Dsin_000983 [Dipteronia sinensis]
MEKNLGCLVIRILKSSYYPTNSFMKTNETDYGSMVWKGLCWGRDLLDIGARIKIGTCSIVSFYEDKWIPRPTTFKIFTPNTQEDYHMVMHLKIPSGMWNGPLIKELVVDEDVKAIMSIPCKNGLIDDTYCWHYTPNRDYIVKKWIKIELFVGASTIYFKWWGIHCGKCWLLTSGTHNGLAKNGAQTRNLVWK